MYCRTVFWAEDYRPVFERTVLCRFPHAAGTILGFSLRLVSPALL